jgi:hypothetical protein
MMGKMSKTKITSAHRSTWESGKSVGSTITRTIALNEAIINTHIVTIRPVMAAILVICIESIEPDHKQNYLSIGPCTSRKLG